ARYREAAPDRQPARLALPRPGRPPHRPAAARRGGLAQEPGPGRADDRALRTGTSRVRAWTAHSDRPPGTTSIPGPCRRDLRRHRRDLRAGPSPSGHSLTKARAIAPRPEASHSTLDGNCLRTAVLDVWANDEER